MESLWTHTAELPHFQKLERDLKTDVLIIGGGITGILCALLLREKHIDCALVESNTICSGVTRNTTAKITVQHGLIYDQLIRKNGAEYAARYLAANREALDKFRSLCAGIDCEFEEKDAYVYTLDDPAKIEREVRAYQALRYPAEYVQDVPLPVAAKCAVRVPGQAQFHPLKFIAAIAGELPIYEHTPVLEMLSPHRARTPSGTITAQKVIAATHFPFINKHGFYFVKMYQARSYVIALENAESVDGMYIDGSGNGLSFRSAGGLLLLGGGGHRTGKKGGGWNALRREAQALYPQAAEAFHWAAQDCMTLDGVPYIGQYSPCTPDFYVATGFNKWGMTSAMAAAMILSDLIAGAENPYADVFAPSRSIFHPQLAVNLFETAVNFLTPSTPRCPHLGCALKWNAQEHTWDCPCHGSRFDEGGKLLDNPATGDLKKHDPPDVRPEDR